MGHNSGHNKEEAERATREWRISLARDKQAAAIVDRWNSELADGKRPQFSPTLEAAFRARRPWLRVYCPGCQMENDVDLRRIVRPQDFPIVGLRAALVCETLCRGQGPVPVLRGLHQFPFDRRRVTWKDRA